MSVQYENFGKYVLLEKLATGGMAEVFLARGVGAGGIGKFFAIKRILPQFADSPEFIDMFKEEAKIAINISHSNIVSIHEFGVEKGQFFLVMDYVEGRNLRQILNKMKKTGLQFSFEQVVYMIKEISAGLDHAHRCVDASTGKQLHITHRDISPQNLMVSFDGEVKIVDFGIAKAETQLENTRAGTLKGKFGYMSPEQAEGQVVDLRTDLFSLGIVLWELIANDRLFVANNEINTLRKIRDCQVPSLRKINPNIHSELERITLKALARDRNLRYQTGAALNRDLSRFLNKQFPEFTRQDFSVFIKNIFADEIMALRKRLVDYSKLNVSIGPNTGGPSERDIKTQKVALDPNSTSASLLDGNTSSVVETVTNGSISEARTLNRQESLVVDVDEKTVASSPGTAVTQITDSELTATLPPETHHTKVLDDKALSAVGKREITVKTKIHNQPSELTGSIPEMESIRQLERKNANRNRPQRSQRPAQQSSSSPRLITMITFFVLCTGAYLYLARYFSGPMADVIAFTDPFLREVHKLAGIQVPAIEQPQRGVSSNQTPVPPGDTKGTAAQPSAGASGAATGGATESSSTATAWPPPQPPLPPHPVELNGAMVVTSNPSGAEIYLNNQSTGMITPSRIQVPSQGTFSLTIRKRGYLDFRRMEVTRESVGHRLDASLQKLNVGYLEIEIFPPQEVVLFVDGKPVSLGKDTRKELTVQGNAPVKVRAEMPNGTGFDETTVAVPTDKRRLIKLNPRKSSR